MTVHVYTNVRFPAASAAGYQRVIVHACKIGKRIKHVSILIKTAQGACLWSPALIKGDFGLPLFNTYATSGTLHTTNANTLVAGMTDIPVTEEKVYLGLLLYYSGAIAAAGICDVMVVVE